MITFSMVPGRHPRELGLIPSFLSEDDPQSAKEQIDKNYKHGGGWNSFTKFRLDLEDYSLRYPDDPPIEPIAQGRLRDEIILIYPYAWVLILQPDNSYDVARID